MKQYSTIFLDWHNTLSYSKFWGQWEGINHQQKNNLFSKVVLALFSLPQETINNWMRGQYTTEQIIASVAKSTHLPYQFLLREFIQSCEKLEYSSPEIPRLIKQLRTTGKRVIIATDNMDCFTRWTIPALQLDTHFDDILNSYERKALKADIDGNGESLFFQNYNTRGSLLLDDRLEVGTIVKKSNIDFLHVTQENNLEKHLQELLRYACY